jgi:hypothetical protein
VVEDSNRPAYVERLRAEIIQNVRNLKHAPGTQFEEAPPEAMLPQYELDDGPLDPTQVRAVAAAARALVFREGG